jgi:hypothetical protein
MRATFKLFIFVVIFIFKPNFVQANTLSPLVVAKTPTCGCCTKWLEHLNEQGLQVIGKNFTHAQMSDIKRRYLITPKYRSCHTAISENGFAFEGHVPAKFIKQFLMSPIEEAVGLTVPAMPIGSPGMEVGNRFEPYKVLLLMNDGTSRLYAEVNSYKEQL